MKGLRTLGVLVVLLGGLGAYLYYVDAGKPVGETEDKPKVFAVEADQIEELVVSTIAGGEAGLKKTADGWSLTRPTQVRADESEVTGITSNLATLTMQRVVDENPSNLGDYGLREPVAEVRFKTKGATGFKTLQVGTKTPTGSDLYAKTADDKKVFLVSGYLESTFGRTPFDLRDKKIISFDREKVDRLEIRRGQSLVSLVKANGEWRMTAPVAARGDFGAIEGLISKLQSAQMKAIVTENPAEFATYGIDPPAARVTIVSGSATAAMAFGSKTADNFIHARDESKPLVVTVPADLFDDVEKGPIEYPAEGPVRVPRIQPRQDRSDARRGDTGRRTPQGQGQGRRGRLAERRDEESGGLREVRSVPHLACRDPRAVVRRRDDEDRSRCAGRDGEGDV